MTFAVGIPWVTSLLHNDYATTEICAVPEGSDPRSGDVTIERATFFQPELCFLAKMLFEVFSCLCGSWGEVECVEACPG